MADDKIATEEGRIRCAVEKVKEDAADAADEQEDERGEDEKKRGSEARREREKERKKESKNGGGFVRHKLHPFPSYRHRLGRGIASITLRAVSYPVFYDEIVSKIIRSRAGN